MHLIQDVLVSKQCNFGHRSTTLSNAKARTGPCFSVEIPTHILATNQQMQLEHSGHPWKTKLDKSFMNGYCNMTFSCLLPFHNTILAANMRPSLRLMAITKCVLTTLLCPETRGIQSLSLRSRTTSISASTDATIEQLCVALCLQLTDLLYALINADHIVKLLLMSKILHTNFSNLNISMPCTTPCWPHLGIWTHIRVPLRWRPMSTKRFPELPSPKDSGNANGTFLRPPGIWSLSRSRSTSSGAVCANLGDLQLCKLVFAAGPRCALLRRHALTLLHMMPYSTHFLDGLNSKIMQLHL